MIALPSILLVEDDETLRDLIGGALLDLGYEVSTAEDGIQAIASLRDRPFDFVLSDVAMPNGMSGLDVAMEAATIRPAARIVLASGFAKAQLPPLPPGVAFLPKPYRIPQLLLLLRELEGGPSQPAR